MRAIGSGSFANFSLPPSGQLGYVDLSIDNNRPLNRIYLLREEQEESPWLQSLFNLLLPWWSFCHSWSFRPQCEQLSNVVYGNVTARGKQSRAYTKPRLTRENATSTQKTRSTKGTSGNNVRVLSSNCRFRKACGVGGYPLTPT
jgi:hypothetical protein